MKRGKLVVTLFLLAGAAGLAVHVTRKPESPHAPGMGGPPGPGQGPKQAMTLRSSDECRTCHEEVFEEWRASHHAIAYTNPEVQRISKGFQGAEGRDCLPCHLPRPVWETGLDIRVLERATGHDDGVDCFTCHFDPHTNAMLGRGPLSAAAATAPCQPVENAGIASLQLCTPCHNQHKVHEDWRQTAFAVKGPGFKDCNGCHMPEVERRPGPDGKARKGRSHAFPGAHDRTMLQSAATLQAEDAGSGKLMITVKNTGTGHNFPADERHRAADLLLLVRTADGRSAQARIDRYRNPYRQEFDLKNPLREPGAERDYRETLGELGTLAIHAVRVGDAAHPQRDVYYPESTQIPAGEARLYTVQLPGGVKEATVRLVYRIQPYLPDDKAVLLHERKIEFK